MPALCGGFSNMTDRTDAEQTGPLTAGILPTRLHRWRAARSPGWGAGWGHCAYPPPCVVRALFSPSCSALLGLLFPAAVALSRLWQAPFPGQVH